jgi:hypothetical protein
VSLLRLIVTASFAFDVEHDLLRKVGWQCIRPRPDQQVFQQRIRELGRSAISTHTSNDTLPIGPRSSAELLIDCEEDRTLRAALVGMLREAER